MLKPFVDRRAEEIAAGTAPDDLATKIMTIADPETSGRFGPEEMLDQVAIFFLAGHETSAGALTWALYLLANDDAAQDRARAEVDEVLGDGTPDLSAIRRLGFTRDVFREALRLYPPPVAMIVRETRREETFRRRRIAVGSFVIVSPWHLHRHRRQWRAPDEFDPGSRRGANEEKARRDAYLPFSAGPRVCPGAGFAMVEGVLALTLMVRSFRFAPAPGPAPVPVMHLTVRAASGIDLTVTRR